MKLFTKTTLKPKKEFEDMLSLTMDKLVMLPTADLFETVEEPMTLVDILTVAAVWWERVLYDILFWPVIFLLTPFLVIYVVIRDIIQMTIEYPEDRR